MTNNPKLPGRENPQPFRTELVWEGKYRDGKRVAPLKVGLPFQTVETINESAQQRQHALDLFSKGGETEWRNRLIWGDKKYVLPSLLAEFAGKVDLVYIDPPFLTEADFSMITTIPDSGKTFTKEASAIEQKAYRDTWGRGNASYAQWLFDTAYVLRDLLSDEGSIFLHLGASVAYIGRAVLDEVFGPDNFRNEIILPGRAVKNLQQQFDAIQRLQVRHDVMIWYSKNPAKRFAPFWTEKHNKGNPEGHWHHFWSNADRPTMRYEIFGIRPSNGQWIWKESRALQAVENYTRYEKEAGGRTLAEYWRDTGACLEFIKSDPEDNKPLYWREPATMRMADTVWSGLPIYSFETGYPTEKNESFLSQVIELVAEPDALVLDCFCGSGTTAAVAEKLGRRWITCDLGRFAIQTTRKRLLGIPGVKPFVVQNLGKYERQQWQMQEFGENAESKIRAYRRFILDLYKAKEFSGKVWLHGVKGGRLVHVGSVDSPISVGDVTQVAKEIKQLIGTGKGAPDKAAVDILGWDFAFEINELAKQQAQSAGIDVRFIHIPREVLEKKAVEQGDIKFFELAALSVKVEITKRKLKIELSDFIMSLDDVPEDIRLGVTHWSQWIDYWAVDWDYQGDAFHNQWQSYRTRKESKLQLSTDHAYAQPGDYTLMVKVIDILGNDTTKTIKVKAE